MSKVESVVVSSVADLYAQFAAYGLSYTPAENPLTGLVENIPPRALYYTVVPEMRADMAMAEAVMKRVAARRKLRSVKVTKDDIKHAAFEPTNQMVIFYA
jgi:hypothetical protein